MKIILGTAVYLLIGGAHILALERYDEGLDSAVLIWCGLCWPVTAPLFGVKLAFARLLEQMDGKRRENHD